MNALLNAFYLCVKPAVLSINEPFLFSLMLSGLGSFVLPQMFLLSLPIPRERVRLVYAVYELGAAQVLKNNLTTAQAEKERAIKIATRKLTEAHLTQNSAETIICEFAAALGWQVDKPDQRAPDPSVTVPFHSASGIVAEILQGKKRNLQFGSYKWRVLDVQDDKALLITEDAIEQRSYNAKFPLFGGVTWETCDLRKYLNGEFLQKFIEEDWMKIAETQIRNPDNLWYDTPGGMDTVDEIFLLSLEEVDRYFGDSGDYQNKRRKDYKKNGKWVMNNDGCFLSNAYDSDRQAKFGNKACWWWLRSPGHSSDDVASVRSDGLVYVYGRLVNRDSGGVRPALWLNLKS